MHFGNDSSLSLVSPLTESHIRRMRSDPAGVWQTEFQPGPATCSIGWPGEDEAVAAGGGGRTLDDRVHALLLCPTEVETASTHVPLKPVFPYWRVNIRQWLNYLYWESSCYFINTIQLSCVFTHGHRSGQQKHSEKKAVLQWSHRTSNRMRVLFLAFYW